MHIAERLVPFGESVFSTMTRLANDHKAINLSQGFPDFDGPDWLKEAAVEAIRNGPNQYAASPGNPDLRRALAEKVRRDYGLMYDPDTEITVCSGATEAIAAVFLGLLNPGDEVILLEPFYDSYPATVVLAGATPRYLATTGPDFAIDMEALEALVNEKTRAILINSPCNPSGKVFSDAELAALAALAQRHPQLIMVTDEVYEHIVFAPHQHHPLAGLPGMRERTILISSFSKSLSMTGWKVGYCFAPAALTQAIRGSHQFLTFCAPAPLQAAYAKVLDRLPEYYVELAAGYRERCDCWMEILDRSGFKPQAPGGTYFVITDVRELGFASDLDFCTRLPAEIGVGAIPASAFYHHKEAGNGLVRWAFCKGIPTLREAGERLKKLPEMARSSTRG
jgi:N-succinyldiaminopimelate aminotransferase